MEFWGVEVKPGQTLKVEPGEEMILHLSQASLGEVKKDKGNDSIILHVKIGDKKLVVGTLSAAKCTHIAYDLVFEKEFELSHSWKNGSVYFCGYKSVVGDDESDGGMFDSDDSEGEDFPVDLIENGKAEDDKAKPATNKANAAKIDAAKKVNVVDPKKGKKPEDDDDEDESDDDSEDESDDEDMIDGEDDSEDEEVDEDDSEDEEDEATPQKVQQGKKRPAESANKAEKKAKLVTPQKSGGDGKKGGGHTATPYPKGGKTPASGDKKQQTPKSAGQVSCKACPKTFTSETAMQSHSKAKHSGGK